MTTATINIEALHAAAKCASNEQTRYYLNGVCTEFFDKEIVYIATDGRVLFAFRQDSTEHTLRGTFIIPSATIKLCKLNKKLPFAELTRHEKRMQLGNVVFEPIDGEFPDWRKVIPTSIAKPEAGSFDPHLLAKLWEAGRIIHAKEPHLTQNGPSNPAYVSFSDGNAFGVIMPRKGGADATQPPAWLNGVTRDRRAAA